MGQRLPPLDRVVYETAVAARELLAEPVHWTQRVAARDAQGQSVAATSPAAVRWCSVGAVWKVTAASQSRRQRAVRNRLIVALERALGVGRRQQTNLIARWQDQPNRPHAEVLAVWDRAVQLLRPAAEGVADG